MTDYLDWICIKCGQVHTYNYYGSNSENLVRSDEGVVCKFCGWERPIQPINEIELLKTWKYQIDY